MMKLGIIIFTVSLLLTNISCKVDNNELYGYCGYPLNIKVENQVGRIYFYALEEGKEEVYCIASIDNPTMWGGYIPCNEIPKDIRPQGKIGHIVIYSGYLMSNSPDPEEPLFMGIELTEIKLASEDY